MQKIIQASGKIMHGIYTPVSQKNHFSKDQKSFSKTQFPENKTRVGYYSSSFLILQGSGNSVFFNFTGYAILLSQLP